MVVEEVIQYYRALTRSDRERVYLAGISPDDDKERWYFEAVRDRNELVAIRQITVEADGTRHCYWAEHMEDDWGGLTDQAIDYEDQLRQCAEAEFLAAWDG